MKYSNKKIKHSKFKNTGLIFEFLLRQITFDILNKKDKSLAVSIVKENFKHNTELGKELNLYSSLVNKKFKSERKADYFINEIMRHRSNLNSSKLRREKYNIIKSIKDSYNVDNFFSSKVPEYKIYASVYKLFEYSDKITAEEKTESYFTIIEHVTTNNSNIKLSELAINLPEDEDLRIITYRTLLEKFNQKHSKLNGPQKSLLRAYINNVSNVNSLKEYIEKVVPVIKKGLKQHSNKLTDKVVQIKLAESIKTIDKFCSVGKSKNVKDNVVVQTMRYMELLKELKKSGKTKTLN